VAHVRVESGIEDALLGHLTDQYQSIDALLAQQVLELGLVEDGVAGLDDEGNIVWGSDGLTNSGNPDASAAFTSSGLPALQSP
jgi:hypothetical protein